MTVKKWICVFGVVAGTGLGVAGCGDDDGNGGQSSEAAARDTGDTAASLNSLKSDPADETSLGNVLELYADAQAISARGFDPSASQPGSGFELSLDKSVRSFAQLGGCVSGSNPYTYTNCVIDPTTFNGTLSVDGDALTFDLNFEVDPGAIGGILDDALQGSGGPVDIDITKVEARETATGLTVTDTRVDGTINISTTVVGTTTISVPGGDDLELRLNEVVSNVMTFSNLAIDTDGCPVGGSLLVTQTSDGFYRPVQVTYGPTCGDVDVSVVAE